MKANKGLKFNTECKIIFGRNISGLIAAKELGMLYPDSRSNIFVVSSVYNTSMKVFAHKISMTQVQCSFKVFGDTPTRAYPIPPLPGTSSIMYNTTDTRSSLVRKKKQDQGRKCSAWKDFEKTVVLSNPYICFIYHLL